MAAPTQCLMITALVFAILTAVFMIIGFTTPYWLQSISNSNAGFIRMGLWEACFDRWSWKYDYMGKVYNGCWWFFSYEFRSIIDVLRPPWFLAVQLMLSVTLTFQLVTVLFLLLILIGCCPTNRKLITYFVTSILMFLSGVFVLISVVLFGVRADTDREWVTTRPEHNFLSWSFGFACLAGVLSLFTGMFLLVEALRFRTVEKRSSHNMRYIAKTNNYAMKTQGGPSTYPSVGTRSYPSSRY